MSDPRRSTPRTDAILADPQLQEAKRRLGDKLVKQAVQAAITRCRNGDISAEEVAMTALQILPRAATGLRPVINATGVVVHTNLGRAPLSAAAIEALCVSAGTTDVEVDLSTGRRGRRGRSAIQALAAAVPDAGGVHVVNNGAAALALVTCALASGREIVISRGELVEIGDGFRIPELLESVGARLREVGTTNRVTFDDYAGALSNETAFILKVHPSNFVVSGFSSSVSILELASLDTTIVADIGSGLLSAHPRLPAEPSAASALQEGADVVTASGDKLLGGPQCGLMFGRAELIADLQRHPFARALRVDKLTLAALEATLTGPAAPVVEFLESTPGELVVRVEHICAELDGVAAASPIATQAAVGGGGAPDTILESAAVALPEVFADRLRLDELTPVLGRLAHGRLLLDLIAVPPEDDAVIVDAVRRCAKSLSFPGMG